MASINTKPIHLLAKRFLILPVALFLAPALHAQEPDTALLSKAMVKYANENAVITNYQQKLKISYEDGQLSANTYIKKERLLIGELAPAIHNNDNVDDWYFSRVSDFNAVAYIPQKNGGFKRTDKYYGGYSNAEFHGLTKGSFIRINATQEHPDLMAIPQYEVDDYYPTMHTELEVVAPKFVDIRFVIKGENTSIIKQTKEEKGGNIIYRFTADNVPAYKLFNRVPSASYYRPHVVCYIASYRLPGQSKDSAILSDPQHLYLAQTKFINNLNMKEDTAMNRLVQTLTKGDVTQRQKAMHLYNWVQKNIHYLALNPGLGGWVPRTADTVLKKKYGDCKDMSSILLKMGKIAGLETYYAWIGTSLNPYNLTETPAMCNFNHMICALKLGNDWIFMDGTHPELPFGANRDDIQGKEVMIAIDKSTCKIMTIPVVNAENNVTTITTNIAVSEKNNQDIVGSFKQKYVGYEAWNNAYLLSVYTKEENERDVAIAKMTHMGSNKFNLDNYNLKLSDTGNKDMVITGNFTIGNYINKAGQEYIINMNLHRQLDDNYIDTTGRKAAWYFDFKNIEKEVVTLDIPKGYKVSYLPKNAHGSLRNLWSYNITYKSDGKKITLTKEYAINTMKITPEYFAENNKAIKELEQQYKETVVLREAK